MPPFHEKIAHGDGGKIPDIHKQFKKKCTRLHEDRGHMVEQHGPHGDHLDHIPVQAAGRILTRHPRRHHPPGTA